MSGSDADPRGPHLPASVRYGEQAAGASDAARQLASSPLANAPAPATHSVLRGLQPVADMEADAVAFAHAIGEVPCSRASRARYFALVRQRLIDAQAVPAQLALVDVVAAVFDYVIDDRRLPEVVRPMVWRLQQPALLLALMDPGYLGSEARSLRSLIENLGVVAMTVGEDLVRGSELHRRLETVVRAIEIVATNLYRRVRVLAEQVDREYRRTSTNMQQLVERMQRERSVLESTPARRNRRDYSRRPGREQERLVTEQLAGHIRQRTRNRRLPDSVNAFLQDVWMRYSRTTLLRDGEDSNEFRNAMAVLDDLLWTLDGGGDAPVRAKLAARIPRLIESLHRGMRQIGERPEDHQDFFDELFLIHLRQLHRVGRLRPPMPGPPARHRPRRGERAAGRHLVRRGTLGAGAGPGTAGGTGALVRAARWRAATDCRAHDSAGDRARSGARCGARCCRRQCRIRAARFLAPGIPLRLRPPRSVATAWRRPGGRRADPLPLGSADRRNRDPAPGRAGAAGVGGRGRAHTDRAGRGEPAEAAVNDDDRAGGRLLELLRSVDLNDLPQPAHFSNARASQQFHQLAPGQWLDHRPEKGRSRCLKVAWINDRRSVALLVRHPDGRAVSRPMSELAQLFRAGRLRVMRASAVA
ncbi:MAG: DUF1631 family protein [Burkholderiaceae bacterium]